MSIRKKLDAVLGSQSLSQGQKMVLEISLAKKLRTREAEDITVRELQELIRSARSVMPDGPQILVG